MIGIHFLSRTPNYFASALLLSFPGLSMTAYWFMYRELGAQKVIDTAHFGAGAGLAFVAFLLGMAWALRRHGIGAAFAPMAANDIAATAQQTAAHFKSPAFFMQI